VFETFTSYVMVCPGSALPSFSGSENESVLEAVTTVVAGSNALGSVALAKPATRAEAAATCMNGVIRNTREMRSDVKIFALLGFWRG
jgi:hypothetical protein